MSKKADKKSPNPTNTSKDNPSVKEDDLKRAQTDIRSACGDEPRDESQRNPIIPPGKESCDTNVEPADPKAPPKADPATPGQGATGRTPEGKDMQEFDERMSTWGGEEKEAAADAAPNTAEDDLKRARTDIRSACGDEPQQEHQRNPIIPPGKESCDTNVTPADPKAPPKADPATPGQGGGGRAPQGADMKDFDERMGSWGGPDTNVSPEDRKRAQTDIRSACGDQPREEHQRNPIIPPGRESCDIPEEPVDHKAPMRSDHYIKPGAGRRARKRAAKGHGASLDWHNARERGEAMMGEAKAKGGAMVDEAGKILHPAIDSLRDRFFQKDDERTQEHHYAPAVDMDFDEDACNFDPHVVEKISAKAIQGVDGVLGLHTSFVEGITQRFSDDAVPGVKAKVDDGEVRIRLRIILSYDAERETVFHAIKDKLLEKLDSACGLKLKAIQIDVADMMTQEEYDKENR